MKRSHALALAAAATACTSAGVGAPAGPAGDGGGGNVGSGTGTETSDPEALEACLPGVWLSQNLEESCYCPTNPDDPIYTPECAHADCIQDYPTVLYADGREIEFTIRLSPSTKTFSAIGGNLGVLVAVQQSWSLDAEGHVVVGEGSSANVYAASCTDERLTLTDEVGTQEGWRAPAALAEAILAALDDPEEDWLSIPYEQ